MEGKARLFADKCEFMDYINSEIRQGKKDYALWKWYGDNEEGKRKFAMMNIEIMRLKQGIEREIEIGEKRFEGIKEFEQLKGEYQKKIEKEAEEMYKVSPEVLALDEDYDCTPYDNRAEIEAELKKIEEEKKLIEKRELMLKEQLKEEKEKEAIKSCTFYELVSKYS